MGAVIIFESDASVDYDCTVLGDLIISLEGCIEVLGILLLGVFYSKIIYHQGNFNVPVLVGPYVLGNIYRVIPVWVEVFL